MIKKWVRPTCVSYKSTNGIIYLQAVTQLVTDMDV